jgi:hypothetical protein
MRDNWFLHQDNARPHTSAFTTKFMEDNFIDTTPHPPYSPDLALSDFWLFPYLKKQLSSARLRMFWRPYRQKSLEKQLEGTYAAVHTARLHVTYVNVFVPFDISRYRRIIKVCSWHYDVYNILFRPMSSGLPLFVLFSNIIIFLSTVRTL